MGELKSAWEVAQERANRLGKLSAEEKEQQERERYRQIGQALAQKWLDDPRGVDISVELNKYQEKERNIIKKAVIERLVQAIDLATTQDMDIVKSVLKALNSLSPEVQTETEQIGQLVQEFQLAEQKIRQELESNYKQALHQLRISGTAVAAVNIENDPQWQLSQHELAESLTPRLNALKQALLT